MIIANNFQQEFSLQNKLLMSNYRIRVHTQHISCNKAKFLRFIRRIRYNVNKKKCGKEKSKAIDLARNSSSIVFREISLRKKLLHFN